MTPPQADSPYKTCQTLQRGLELLQCFNGIEDTACKVSELSKRTGLHRTTVKRLLETLRLSGFVKYDALTGLYSLTYQVRSLSCGFRDSVEVVELAFPILKEVSKQIAWPCTILVFDKDAMVVRSGTRAYSHLSFHSALPGRRMPILSTAAGQAYFSFMTEKEQELVLELLIAQNDEYVALAQDTQFISNMIQDTKRQGYAVNNGIWKEESKFGAVAFPIFKDEKVIACINCIYLTSAVKKLNQLSDLIKYMKMAKDKIEHIIYI